MSELREKVAEAIDRNAQLEKLWFCFWQRGQEFNPVLTRYNTNHLGVGYDGATGLPTSASLIVQSATKPTLQYFADFIEALYGITLPINEEEELQGYGGMSELREKIAKAMYEVHPENDPKPWEWVVQEATVFAEHQRINADAAIAAVFEALQSDAVVEAGAKGVAELDWTTDEVGFFPLPSDVARTAIRSAIAALGHGAGEEEGE